MNDIHLFLLCNFIAMCYYYYNNNKHYNSKYKAN